MPAGSEGIQRFAVADEDRRLILAHDQLGSEPEFAGAGFGHSPDDFVWALIGPLDQIQNCQCGFS
jgi:hypothetical protein